MTSIEDEGSEIALTSGRRWLVGLVIAWTAACGGCAPWQHWRVFETPKSCKLGADCVLQLGLKALDVQHPDLCVLLVDSNTVRAAKGVVVEWDLKTDTTGRVIRFKPLNRDGSAAGAGIDIALGADSPPDFVLPRIDSSGTKFYWTANPSGGSGKERAYTVNVELQGFGTPIPCKLDPIIVNEG